MFGRKNPEALVVGAGPVGLFAALRLARSAVDVQIVDRDWRTGAHSYALALHSDSLRMLDESGLRDRVLEKAYPVRTVAIYDGSERRAQASLGSEDDPLGCVAAMRQDVLEHLLEEAIHETGFDVFWNHELARLTTKGDRVAATVNKMVKESVGYAVAHTEWIVAKSKELKVPFLIGADGHRSLVRRSSGIDYEGVGQPEHFAVFEFKTDADLAHEMCVAVHEDTTNVLWPLPDGYCRWSFQLTDYKAPERTRVKDRIGVQVGSAHYPVLSEESLHALIAERAPWFEGRVEEVRWRLVVRFERRMASTFGSGRIWLAGDAGHMTGPAGMQSMNVGLREARDLAEILTDVLRHGHSLDRLEAYNRQRLDEWRFLLGRSGSLRSTDQTDPWVAEHAARILPCLPASGDDLAALAKQLGLEVDLQTV